MSIYLSPKVNLKFWVNSCGELVWNDQAMFFLVADPDDGPNLDWHILPTKGETEDAADLCTGKLFL